jgi:hypothetical protein
MCWQCDNPHRTTDDYLDVLREIINGHGWAVQYVEGEDRPFAYTVGLTDLGLPELLITGLPPRTAKRLLNSIAHDMVDDGTILRDDDGDGYDGDDGDSGYGGDVGNCSYVSIYGVYDCVGATTTVMLIIVPMALVAMKAAAQ